MDPTRTRTRLRVTGVVQGVGFRPFVHRLATGLGLDGLVGNDAGAVFVEVEGPAAAVREFAVRLPAEAPPLARVDAVSEQPLHPTGGAGFVIVPSDRADDGGVRTLVPPDVATCDACLAELLDPADRRHRHPFITCTDCGPRFTIVTDLPYDRPATTMAGFPMCPACAAEYHDPADRRYHAQPVACPDCGPVLTFRRLDGRPGEPEQGGDGALAAAQRALAAGDVVAVKGIGGYHLACRADDPAAVARLRARKQRGDKPFAVLARDPAVARRLVVLDAAAEAVLGSPARPILLADKRPGPAGRVPGVAEEVAPGNPQLGVLLPYSPVHHLLLAPVPGADGVPPDVLVLTSANLTDEPLVFDDADAATRLPLLADAVLGHDRPVRVPCDDSVVRVLDGRELPVRRSRGYAPLPVALPAGLAGAPRVLAVGAELKNTFCVTEGPHAFCSAHVGDMGSVETLQAFERAVGQLVRLVGGAGAEPELVAADLHPAYLTGRWAERYCDARGLPEPVGVQHHHAHVVSLLAEHGAVGRPVVGIAFDGTGFGTDGTVWGGEVLVLGRDAERFVRAGHLLPVGLPGGDAAVRNPCRTALSYLAAAGVEWADDLPAVAECTAPERAVVAAQLAGRGAAAVPCSSAGRLFDAVSSLLGLRHRVGFEAQAAIDLEALAAAVPAGGHVLAPFGVRDGVLDHRPAVRSLVDGLRAGVPVAALARAFHEALADAVLEVTEQVAGRTDIRTVGLTGGVFQNVLLLTACRDRLQAAGFDVLTHRLVPPNDGGLSLGQAVVAALLHRRQESACA